MEVIFHRLIQKDLREALDYYETEGGSKLADRFFEEAEAALDRVVGCHVGADRVPAADE